MIDAKDLRIGNKVAERNNHRIYEVKNILTNSVVVRYWSCGENEEIPCNRLMPIPLTPEILEKCGFDVTPPYNTYNKNDLDACFGFRNGVIECNPKHIKYLHQLQNLYFALTGEELKINLNVEAVNG